MRRTLLVTVAALAFAASALAQRVVDENGRHTQLFPTQEEYAKSAPARGGSNLSYHGGPVITSAKVVAIFWGDSATWGTPSSPSVLAGTIRDFFGNFGTTAEYNVITQYSGIQKSGLTTTHWIDNSSPPTNVTDAIAQSKVQDYIHNFQGGFGDPSTIYEVFLPPGVYASYGSATSCGGPNLVFCAYHSNFTYNGVDIKYSSMPYPSCSGCQWPGWSDALNFEHFACHETREAATDPDGDAWFDRAGNEADDKCAWSPNLFTDAGFGYQYEWSNAARGCVQKQ